MQDAADDAETARLFIYIYIDFHPVTDATIDKSQICNVVLVGGSTRIPQIQQLLKNFCNGKLINFHQSK